MKKEHITEKRMYLPISVKTCKKKIFLNSRKEIRTNKQKTSFPEGGRKKKASLSPGGLIIDM